MLLRKIFENWCSLSGEEAELYWQRLSPATKDALHREYPQLPAMLAALEYVSHSPDGSVEYLEVSFN